jgi:hypothetical protein
MKRKRKKAARVKIPPSRTLATLAKRRKGAGTARSRLRLESVLVDDRDDDIRGETVRIVDTVTLLHRRKQIDDRQLRAAEVYRDAAAFCGGSIPSLLSRRQGQQQVRDCSPTEAQMRAAQLLRQAGAFLGHLDAQIVCMVASAGHTIDECAARLFGLGENGKAHRADAEHVGRRLRLALQALAASWWPEHTQRPLWMKPVVDNPGEHGQR